MSAPVKRPPTVCCGLRGDFSLGKESFRYEMCIFVTNYNFNYNFNFIFNHNFN